MTTEPVPQFRQNQAHPWAELLLIIGLPLAVLLAGAITTVTAYRQGFTPVPATAVAPKGH